MMNNECGTRDAERSPFAAKGYPEIRRDVHHSSFIILHSLLICWLLLAGAGPACAGDWPQWRGPFFNGSADETSLPDRWSPTENVAWFVPMPGESGATPVVLGERVFVSSTESGAKGLFAICVSRDTGEVLWKKRISDSGQKIGNNTMASPSPVAEKNRVCFMYGPGDLVSFDNKGEQLWRRDLAKDLGNFSIMWGYGSSPLLYKGRLYIVLLRNTRLYRPGPEVPTKYAGLQSLVLCVNPATGKTIWEKERKPAPTAQGENLEAYSTAIPHGDEILVAGADCITGQDWATGVENWRFLYNPRKRPQWRVVPSPVVAEGVIVGAQPRGTNALFAFRPGAAGKEIPYESAAWTIEGGGPDVVTPLYYKSRLYVLDGDKKIMRCLEPETGKRIWEGDLGGADIFRASPSGADGKIYCINMGGEAVVLKAGDAFEVLSRTQMGGAPCSSSIAIAGGCLFIRTADKLYRVKK
jgi:outer membrane protein assembly factor BamB